LSTLDAAAAVDLVRRIAAGEAAAEAELVERCGGALRFLARRFTRSEADAEDLYQETLILAIEKIRRREVREPERLAGFLRALVKNLSTQQYRRRSYEAEKPSDHLANLPDVADIEDERLPSPLGGLLHQERSRLTHRLLEELNVPRDRDVLLRYYIAEDSSARICADLEIDEDHFYRVLSRARQRYRRLWEEQARSQ
jgi:RNA polymerase sigma-70 factor (ECF subfamily)